MSKIGYSSEGKFEVGSGVTVGGVQVIGAPSATQAAIATANASDLATAQALANDLKTQFNALLAKLKTHGLIASA